MTRRTSALKKGQTEERDSWDVRWRTVPGDKHCKLSALGEVLHYKPRSGWSAVNMPSSLLRIAMAATFLGPGEAVSVDGTEDCKLSNIRLKLNGSPKKKPPKKHLTDDTAQVMINEWDAGLYENIGEIADGFGVSKDVARHTITGRIRKHLIRPPEEERRPFVPYTPPATRREDLRSLVQRWNAGEFITKKAAAAALGLERTQVTRILNGDASKALYEVIGTVTRIESPMKHLLGTMEKETNEST